MGSASEGGHRGGCGFAGVVPAVRISRLVRLPVFAGDVGERGDGAFGGGEEASPGRTILETVGATAVLVSRLVGDAAGEIADLGDPQGAQLAGATGGCDVGSDDALEAHLHRLLVEVVRQLVGAADDEFLGVLADRRGIDGIAAEGCVLIAILW